jgi:hypothetical protein
MTIETLNLVVFLFGLGCMVIPFTAALYFWRDDQGVGRRVAYMLLGETWAVMVTMMFAYQSVDHGYNAMPPIDSAILRGSMFLVQLITTAALVHYLLDQLRNKRGDE